MPAPSAGLALSSLAWQWAQTKPHPMVPTPAPQRSPGSPHCPPRQHGPARWFAIRKHFIATLSRWPFGGRARGQPGARTLPGQRWGGAVGVGGSAPAPHSCLQKLLSGGGRSRPSMARRWTMCRSMTSRQSVCREGTAGETGAAAEPRPRARRAPPFPAGGSGPGPPLVRHRPPPAAPLRASAPGDPGQRRVLVA